MALGAFFTKLLTRQEETLPGEQTTILNASYSDREFRVTGLERDISVFGQIAETGGIWEPHIMNLMARLVRPKNVCLDIGANIGAHTLVLADLARRGVVHSFEPSSINSRFLARNIRQNRMRNVSFHAIGLGNAPGHGQFTNLVGMEGCSFVNPIGQPVDQVVASAWGTGVEQKTETINIDTLDGWMASQRLRRVDFVKMDVEGFELAVLDGGRETFSRHSPKLIIEVNRNTLQLYFGLQPRLLFDRLSEIYTFIYLISEDLSEAPRRVTCFEVIEPLLATPNHWWVDLLCQPEPF